MKLSHHKLQVGIKEEKINHRDLMFLSHPTMKNVKWIKLHMLHSASNKFIPSSLLPLISSLRVKSIQGEEIITHLEVNRIFSSKISITMLKTRAITKSLCFTRLSLTRKIREEKGLWTVQEWLIQWVSKGAIRRNISLHKSLQSIRLCHLRIQSKVDFKGQLSLIQVRWV